MFTSRLIRHLGSSSKARREFPHVLLWVAFIIICDLVPNLPYAAALSLALDTSTFTTASGRPVCRYALGGAARSSQPSSLPYSYYLHLQERGGKSGAPFLFYYNPHRYPAFMAGIKDLCSSKEIQREDLFIASGGTDRSKDGMEKRLADALIYSGGEFLDMFVLEYVCPNEITKMKNSGEGTEIHRAIEIAQSWVESGLVRYVAVSTHSHVVGAALAEENGVDALMLRYSMSHKDAAQNISFPACVNRKKPVLAFTTTRWNALQKGHEGWNNPPPTTGECLSFALASTPPVEIVLHSAREENELNDALEGLENMSAEMLEKWSSYGDLTWNDDGFDEYPEERFS